MARQLSTQAAAAKLIRAELKKAFPGIKFSVTSSGYSMGDSVNVDWIDGPTAEQVGKITNKYQYGSFNGMEDIYEYDNRRKDIPQTKYLFNNRSISDVTYQACFEYIKKHFANCDHLESAGQSDQKLMQHWGVWTASNLIYRFVVKHDLSNGVSVQTIFKC